MMSIEMTQDNFEKLQAEIFYLRSANESQAKKIMHLEKESSTVEVPKSERLPYQTKPQGSKPSKEFRKLMSRFMMGALTGDSKALLYLTGDALGCLGSVDEIYGNEVADRIIADGVAKQAKMRERMENEGPASVLADLMTAGV